MMDNKTKFIYKAIMALLAMIAMGIAVTMMVFIFGSMPMPAFFDHWGVCISLLCMGGICFILMATSQSKYSGSDSKDQFMMIVLVVLVLVAAMSVIMSYTGLFSLSSMATGK